MEEAETGILGPDGEPIYTPGMQPIGFIHWPEGHAGLVLGDPLGKKGRGHRRKAPGRP